MADPANADVIRAVQRDAVPSQCAIGGGELLAARAGVGGSRRHFNVDRRALASRQGDFCACFIGKPLFFRSNLEASRTQASLLVAPRAVRYYRARFSYVDVLDRHRDLGKGCAGLV